MSVDNFRVKVEGLEELQSSLNLNRINKEVSTGVGLFARKLHSELRFSIKQKYNMGKNPKSLDSVLVGNSTSTQQFGRNVIIGGLTYVHIPIGLAKFPYGWFWGNINKPPAKRKGRVHYSQVKRGNTTIVYGKEHRGGFVPIREGGAVVLQNGHSNMLERKGPGPKPLRLLFGPSLANMAFNALRTDPAVLRSLDNLDNFVAENIKL